MTSEILAVNTAFYRAFEKKDIDAMSAVWSQGIGSTCVHPGRSILRGWKQVRISWEQIFRSTAYIEINLDIMATEVADNIAYVVLVENILQVVNGRRLEAQSIATNVFQLFGGKWYLVHHHGSPIMR
ncbi:MULTISPECIES: nuclear transport factor 2 family protein [Calothrix]|uniref:Nuclear transport factor 2 family protein n=2 Tax=Calothrix TaxID=1186 RepID=A0ABR8AJE3_9CYAN|nr:MULTISPECIES: nuclear transport factor 2 family protein [Calothrix]MBD2199869.1 nuclear transport factor 2 family protein [Calothrix parietina FACHB-288]MBD2228784.1 nuclear transport factor 2 family protein [Calothrix anomala FACHB-343]